MFKALFVMIISGFCYYYSIGFHNFWFLMWIAPIPLLAYAYQESSFKTLIVSLVVGLAPGLNDTVGYYATYFPFGSLITETITYSIEWSVVILLTRFLVLKVDSAFAILVYPTVLGLMEWLQSFSPQGTFDTIAYSQLPVLPVMQIASITGYLGVGFTVALFASVFAYGFVFYKKKPEVLPVGIICLILIAAVLSFGLYRVHQNTNNVPTVNVGLASVNKTSIEVYDPALAQELITEYQAPVAELAKQGAQVILLPQAIAAVNQENYAMVTGLLGAMAKDNHVTLIAGVHKINKTQEFDAGWLFNDQGALSGEYYKENFLPVLEQNFIPGVMLLQFPLMNHTAGISISRDMDYINPAHQYAEHDTSILFVPAWDFGLDANVDIQGARVRGIENGYTLVRAARNGLLTVSSPTGEILGSASAIGAGATTLLVSAPLPSGNTFYAYNQNDFLWILWLLMLLLVFRATFKIHQ